jgi:type II secretory pathway pseudopilin PulG
MIKNGKKKNLGFTLLETLFYISMLAIVSTVVINSLVVMMKSFKEITVQRELAQSATIMERMTREIRQSLSIDTISSTDLSLNTKDGAGNSKTVEFALSGTDIHLLENDVLTGNLNAPDILVTALSFTQITTTKGTAIKIFLTVQSKDDKQNRAKDFYDTIVLRGDY